MKVFFLLVYTKSVSFQQVFALPLISTALSSRSSGSSYTFSPSLALSLHPLSLHAAHVSIGDAAQIASSVL